MNRIPAVFVDCLLAQLSDAALSESKQLAGAYHHYTLKQINREIFHVCLPSHGSTSRDQVSRTNAFRRLIVEVRREDCSADAQAEKWIKALQFNVYDFYLFLGTTDINEKFLSQTVGWNIRSLHIRYEISHTTHRLLSQLVARQQLRTLTLRNSTMTHPLLLLCASLVFQRQFEVLQTKYFCWPVYQEWLNYADALKGKTIIYTTWTSSTTVNYTDQFKKTGECSHEGAYSRSFELEHPNGYKFVFKCTGEERMKRAPDRLFVNLCEKKEIKFM